MSHEPLPNDVRTPADVTPHDGPAMATVEPALGALGPLDVVIRNLEGGQTIEMDVRGRWTERELEDRLLRFVSVRQPAVLLLNVEADGTGDEPLLARPRAAIEAFGGTLTVAMTPSIT